jgi:hypothetical protein
MDKTVLSKEYNWGFVLSEQELRRIVQECRDHILKTSKSEKWHQSFIAKCADGSIVETETVDGILSLENAGSKKIERLILAFDDGKNNYDAPDAPEPEWSIVIRFKDNTV